MEWQTTPYRIYMQNWTVKNHPLLTHSSIRRALTLVVSLSRIVMIFGLYVYLFHGQRTEAGAKDRTDDDKLNAEKLHGKQVTNLRTNRRGEESLKKSTLCHGLLTGTSGTGLIAREAAEIRKAVHGSSFPIRCLPLDSP